MIAMVDAMGFSYGWSPEETLSRPLASILLLMRQRKFAQGDQSMGTLATQEYLAEHRDELNQVLETL